MTDTEALEVFKKLVAKSPNVNALRYFGPAEGWSVGWVSSVEPWSHEGRGETIAQAVENAARRNAEYLK